MGSLMTSRREERARELEKEDEPSKRLRLLSINKTVLNKIIVANELRIWRKEERERKKD